VFLTYRGRAEVDRLADRVMQSEPLYDFTASDGVRHVVWRITDAHPWIEEFGTIQHAYVADGHHRSASAWRAGRELRAKAGASHGNEEYNWFLAVLFPAEQLKILPYNRLVRDLNGKSAAEVLDELRALGTLAETAQPAPEAPGSIGIFLGGRWYRLTFTPESIDRGDPIGSLDVSLLQDRVLTPILGVGDPRMDARIDFVGGIRGTAELERRVTSREMAIGFAMYPTTLEQLMAVSDAGLIMPPKSTWFEPKLRSGLFVHTLD
jgi:uncharacterized protein (DUF1015 family)